MGNSNTTIKQTVDEFRKDDDGNIIGCPHCGARSLRKDGFSYYKKTKKQQWCCYACGRKTLNPIIVEESPFKVANRDPELMPIEEIINFRTKAYRQKKNQKKVEN